MRKLSSEEQLLTLAYAGIPKFFSFSKNHPEIPDKTRIRAACICLCAIIIFEMKRYDRLPDDRIDRIFSQKEMEDFFNSLEFDDPRDTELITALIKGFHQFTDSGRERYADFEPFTPFEYTAWLNLIIRIQKSDSVDLKLKVAANLFVAEGFDLILHPSLDEFDDSVKSKFFSWFERLESDNKEKIVAEAMETWKEHEEDKSYNISGQYGKKWYKAALEFAVKITSKEYVSKVFAESFKEDYPKVYEKFRALAKLNEYEVVAPELKPSEQEKAVKTEMEEMFGQYNYGVDELAKLISQDVRVETLAAIIIAISTNASDNRYEHVRQTLVFLGGEYKDCELVKKLTSIFTQSVEKKIEAGKLECTDLPPMSLYVENPDLAWLF